MNEGRFKMFLMYMIDLHNHRLQNTLQVAANPLNDDRESFNMKHVDKIDEYSSASTANNVVDENLKGLINDMAIKINILLLLLSIVFQIKSFKITSFH